MKISISQVNGVKFDKTNADHKAILEKVANELRAAYSDAGFITHVKVEAEKASISYGHLCDRPQSTKNRPDLIEAGIVARPPASPMAKLDTDKHGKTLVCGKIIENTRQKLDWVQRIYLNNLTNDVLDSNKITADIKGTMKDHTKANQEGKDGKAKISSRVIGQIVVRSSKTGRFNGFAKGDDSTLSLVAFLETGRLLPNREKVECKVFKDDISNAIAIRVQNGINDFSELTEKRVLALCTSDPAFIKYMITNSGKLFVEKFAKQILKADRKLAIFAVNFHPVFVKFFSSDTDVVFHTLKEFGLACIKFVDNPSELIVSYVKANWPTYEKALNDIEAIRAAHKANIENAKK